MVRSRLGKRIVLDLEPDFHLVIHLMIAGRFRWRPPAAALPKKGALAAFDFPTGSLVLTEAGTRRRASLALVRGTPALSALDPGGLEVLGSTVDAFAAALTRENHTLKRALTDPRLFSGIGNAYSDEILHAARLSPLTLTRRLTADEIARLTAATVSVLTRWRDALIAEIGPVLEKVTAFRPGWPPTAALQPCPACGTPIQRIRYAANEANYCPTCQTDGRLLADRSLSRLLRDDWPRSLDEMEQYLAARRR